jgi:tetratricopeptide (TPR) repeat protein
MLHLVYVLGLLSKPMLVTLPFVLLLLDYWPLKRIQSLPKSDASGIWVRPSNLLPLVKEKIGLFILALTASLVTYFVQGSGGNVGSLQVYPVTIRLANALVAYVGYMTKMIWPTKLAVLYPHSGMPPVWKLAGAVCMLVLISFLTLKSVRKFPWLLVGWLWYLGTLVPVIGFVQVGVQSMADRYTYIPLIGLFLAIVWGIPPLLPNNLPKKQILFPMSTVLILLLSVLSWMQVRHWSNSISLFQRAITVTDGNYIMHNNLGVELREAGRIDDAMAHYLTAIRIKPGFVEAHLNLGVLLADQGRFEAAIEKFLEVLQIDPSHVTAHLNLGNNQLRLGYAREAANQYLAALKLDPGSPDAYNGLGAAMVKIEKYEKACVYFRKALLLDPEHAGAMENLSRTLAALDRLKEKVQGEQDDKQ